MKWRFDLASDIGGRAEQQDRAQLFTLPGRANGFLLVVADGMGGQQDGGLASQAVIETAAEAVQAASTTNPQQFLGELCERAHRTIREIGIQRSSNPASTCVLLFLRGDEAYWAHVGDSRLYHFGADGLLSCTRDHTVGELLRDTVDGDMAGIPGQVADSRLYMCLGGQNELAPEFGATAVGNDDCFVLCSDGFWNHVDADEASALLRRRRPPQRPAVELVDTATRRAGSGGDNVSVAVATRHASVLNRTLQRILPGG